MKKLSIDNALNQGYESFKKFGAPLVIFTILLFIIGFIFGYYSPSEVEQYYGLFQVIFYILLGILSLIYLQLTLKAVHHKQFKAEHLLISPIRIIYMIFLLVLFLIPIFILGTVSSIPMSLIVILPLMIAYLVFANIYLSQAKYFILDKGYNPLQAIKASFSIMKGNGIRFILFNVCLMTINVLGLLCFLVGYLITLPLTETIKAQLYQNLSS